MSSERLLPILDAVRAKVEGLAFEVNGTVLPVLRRKKATRRQKMDPRSMITVAKSASPEQTTRRRWGLWQTAYLVDVVVHSPYTGPDDGVGEYAAIRDRLVDAFKAPPLPGAPEVFEMDAQAADWLSPYGEDTEWDWFAAQVTATVAHVR